MESCTKGWFGGIEGRPQATSGLLECGHFDREELGVGSFMNASLSPRFRGWVGHTSFR